MKTIHAIAASLKGGRGTDLDQSSRNRQPRGGESREAFFPPLKIRGHCELCRVQTGTNDVEGWTRGGGDVEPDKPSATTKETITKMSDANLITR